MNGDDFIKAITALGVGMAGGAFAVGVDIAISNRPATCAKQRLQFLARPN